MHVSRKYIIYCSLILCLIGSRWFFDSIDTKTVGYTEEVLDRSIIPGHIKHSAVLNPVLDIKLEILRSQARLGTKAKEILNSDGMNVENEEDFKIVFDYFFLLDDYESITELVDNYEGFSAAIRRLDFAFLLPAYLQERMGLLHLARMNYGRYYLLVRKLSLKHEKFSNIGLQNRLTVVRIKLEFLKQAIPALREEYYKVSRFSALTDDFFEFYVLGNPFLKKYIENELMNDGYQLQNYKLQQFVRNSNIRDAPFAHYEGYIVQWGRNRRRCLDTLLDSLQTISPFLYNLSVFQAARYAEQNETLEVTQNLYEYFHRPSDLGAAEFIRDDALVFQALFFYRLGDEDEGDRILNKLIREFDESANDAIAFAKVILEERRIAPDLGNEYQYPPRAADYIRVGSFSVRANAERLVNRLDDNFVSLLIHQATIRGKTFYQVYIGPFYDNSTILRAEAKLRQLGFEDFIRTQL